MDEESVRTLLEQIRAGEISVDEGARKMRFLPFTETAGGKIDHHREQRCGIAEVVFGPGKTSAQLVEIVKDLLARSDGAVIVTKATAEQFETVRSSAPEAHFFAASGLIVAQSENRAPEGVVLIASAGLADQAVAEEASETSAALGLKVEKLADVGIAGVHRLLAAQDALDRADIVIAVAGMDGALPTLIAGLIAAPVVAVPTSVGYGAGAGGIAPLLTMLNSCAPGIAVVNIDNGFGAAVFAAAVLRGRLPGREEGKRS